MKEFFNRLFIVFKGGDTWLDDKKPIKTEKETDDSIIFIDPDPYAYLDEK